MPLARSAGHPVAASLGMMLLAILLATLARTSPLPLLVIAQPHPAATQIVYQQGVSPTAGYAGTSDTYISRLGDESANYGSYPILALYSSDRQAILLRFDLEGLEAGDTVEQAILSLYVVSHPTGTSSLPISAYRVLRPWAETEATWYNATTSDLWTLAGCNGPGSDRASAPVDSTTVVAADSWVDLDITGLVQAWLEDPSSNLGVIIKAGSTLAGPAQAGDQYLLRSANDAGDPNTRPKLTISYTPAGAGSPTPTPVYGSPTTVVFQQLVSPSPDYEGVYDTFISDYGDLERNYGRDAALRLRSNDHRASLLRFNLSSIPPYAVVYSATLGLYSQSRTNVNPLLVTGHRLLRSWVETEATWIIAARDQRWAFPGANGLTTDRAAEPFATMVISATSVWTTWDMTALVRDWVAEPATNNGIILKAGSGPQVEFSLVSAQYLANPALRPRLEVMYALPENVTPMPTNTRTPTAMPSVTPTPSVVPTFVVFQYGQRPDTGYTQVQDTYISREGDVTANYGLDPVLAVGAKDSQAALLRFDLTRIPSWATVHSAELSLFADRASIGFPLALRGYQLLRPWVETEATWLNATRNIRWSAPGANGLGVDCVVTGTEALTVSSISDWYTLDVTAMTSWWVANPEENYGVILKGIPGPQVTYDFVSSQFPIVPAAVFRPKLTVAYTLPEGPTPTATNTRTPTPTATRSYTYLPVILSLYEPPPTATPTATPEIPPTATATRTETLTPTHTPSATSTATHTPTPTPVTIVFRQGASPFPSYGGVQDTYISNYAVGDDTTSFSASAFIALRADNRRVGLMRFDVSIIPSAAQVLTASLSLYADSQTAGSLPLTVSAHEVLRPWVGEQATWLQAANGSPWGAPGASADSDRRSVPAVTQTVDRGDAWYEFDLRDLVQSWTAKPAANWGVLLAAQSSGDVEFLLRSSDYANPSYRPKLVVTYIP